METIPINKQAIADLLVVQNQFNTIIESLELMGNREFMESLQKSKSQVANREFADFDEL